MKKVLSTVLCVVLAAVACSFAACGARGGSNASAGGESVSSIDEVDVSGKTFRLASLECEDENTENKYLAVLEGCIYDFMDDTSGVFTPSDAEKAAAFTYNKVSYGTTFGVQLTFGEDGSFLFIDNVWIPSSLTYTREGSITYKVTENKYVVTMKFEKI